VSNRKTIASISRSKRTASPPHMNSEATGRLFARQAVQLREILTDLGLVK
jgi:hypothetical protein